MTDTGCFTLCSVVFFFQNTICEIDNVLVQHDVSINGILNISYYHYHAHPPPPPPLHEDKPLFQLKLM